MLVGAGFPVADPDADPVVEPPFELLPELPHATVSTATESTPRAVRTKRPARVCPMTLPNLDDLL
jgi:hypothetical protein